MNLNDLTDSLPPLASPRDLVQAGIFGSTATLCRLRKHGGGPPYIQPSKGVIRYPRDGVKEYLQDRRYDGSE